MRTVYPVSPRPSQKVLRAPVAAPASSFFHVQLLFLLFVVSLLMFLSSFISLQHHPELHTNPVPDVSTSIGSSSLRVFNQPLNVKVSSPQPVKTRSSMKAEPTNNNKKKQALKKDSVFSYTDKIAPSPEYPYNPNQNPSSTTEKRCLIHFAPKCPIHPLVHYWNEYTDCFISPLREINGLKAKSIEDQRFIVFQPDLGGWNNIRMALEVVILFAKITGRILVMPPDAVLYLLILNKKWGENKSNMDDYFDFSKLQSNEGLEVMPMKEFLTTIAKNGLLSLPLPDNNVELIRKPLWDYLEKACYVRTWSPGKTFIGFNISTIEVDVTSPTTERTSQYLIGNFDAVDPLRIKEFSIKGQRSLVPYDEEFHKQRAIYFPGHEDNRLLTHFYSYLFFHTRELDHKSKRYMRDRLRYHEEMFCVASKIINKLLILQEHSEMKEKLTLKQKLKQLNEIVGPSSSASGSSSESTPAFTAEQLDEYYSADKLITPTYAAFHIRRGDFQQKHTRLPAETIVSLTNKLIPHRKKTIVYISTDEKNRSFFDPFRQEYKAIYFLDDLTPNTGIETVNQNYIGMIEQIVCVAADVFIGTPLSTFTAYITRMRGYLNRTIDIPFNSPSSVTTISQPLTKGIRMNRAGIYEKTFYFMKHHMYQLQQKPKVNFPLWVRDFVDVFQDIDV
eukprot:gene10025-10896_t